MKINMFFCKRHVNQIERYNLEQKTSNRRESKTRVDKFDHAVNREIFQLLILPIERICIWSLNLNLILDLRPGIRDLC